MGNDSNDRKWYEKTWVIAFTLLFFYPIGLIFLWRCSHVSKKLKLIVTVIMILIVASPSVPNDKKVVRESKKSVSPPMREITMVEAKARLDEMSQGLDVYYDDMKGFTICRCQYGTDYNSVIVPVVIVYDDYSVSLNYHILYCGREPLHFDTLYVKTVDGVESLKYNDVSILYGHVVVEEHKGKMSDEVYKVLKSAVNSNYAKIRLEGKQMDERELTREELSDFAKVFSIYEFFSSVKVK